MKYWDTSLLPLPLYPKGHKSLGVRANNMQTRDTSLLLGTSIPEEKGKYPYKTVALAAVGLECLRSSLMRSLPLPLQGGGWEGDGLLGGSFYLLNPFPPSGCGCKHHPHPNPPLEGEGINLFLLSPGCMHAPVRREKGPLDLFLFPSHPLEGGER